MKGGFFILKKTNFKNKVELLLFHFARKFLKLLSEKTSKKLIIFIVKNGGFYFNVRRDLIKEQITKSNIIIQKSINDFIKECYEHLGYLLWETFIADVKKLNTQSEIVGIENLKKAYNEEKGVILVTGHIGNWEIPARLISSLGMNISAIVKKMRNPYFNEIIELERASNGVELIYFDQSLTKIVRALRAKRIVAFAIDQNAKERGIILDFLGRKTSTYTGAARFAIKFNCPIVVAFGIRQKDNSLKYFIQEAIYAKDFENANNQIEVITDYFNKQLEKQIRETPEQWFWVHRRWKNIKKYLNKEDK